ncbi:MAG: hypothetical protein ACR2QH_05535 [Geminicoccaceae bacterium]
MVKRSTENSGIKFLFAWADAATLSGGILPLDEALELIAHEPISWTLYLTAVLRQAPLTLRSATTAEF